ncbi:MAG: TonB-dependent receptor [Ignavibacteriae bacterium HGW-Ignavibacteriae-4]|nr:MAG: TonB-dependent receptor [Ignavibacteriae bacterium HGW-Ignavibacteriae-4]
MWSSKMNYLTKIILLFGAMTIMSMSLFSQTGTLSGKITDQDYGDAMIGATVQIKDTKLGAMTKIDGSYIIKKITPGTYTVTFSYIGYAKTEVKDVIIKADEVTKIDVALKTESGMSEEVLVTAKAVQETGAALLKERQKSQSFSDAIGSKEISRGGASDAASAMNNVTGASVVDGKHVLIRGLGDRYSNTQLNGTSLPSSDPDKKSVQLDLFPAAMIENIVTIKTATPDKPGDFTGGSVNIKTKSFPDKFKAGLSLSSTANSIVTGQDVLTYNGSSTDWLGFDNGKRNVPDAIQNSNGIPSVTEVRSKKKDTDGLGATKLNDLSNAFDSEMAPSITQAPLNGKMSLNMGDQFTVFGNSMGYLASLSYANNNNNYSDGQFAIYELTSGSANELRSTKIINDSKSSSEVNWGTLANIAYDFTPTDQVKFNLFYNQSGEAVAQSISYYDEYYPEASQIRSSTLKYTERNIQSYQLSGEHSIASISNAKVEWNVSTANTLQNEPDLRFFTYEINNIAGTDTTWRIDENHYDLPTRYYRDLQENSNNAKLDIEIPLTEAIGTAFKLKTGFAFQAKDRNFNQDRYVIGKDHDMTFDGNVNQFVKDSSGISDWKSTNNFNYFGLYIEDRFVPKDAYTGKEDISAFYGMVDVELFTGMRLIGGARLESTDMSITSRDTSLPIAAINKSDLLPSMNAIYNLTENQNIRFAYGKTLARPTFRELADFDFFEFVGGYTFIGNPDLQRSLIDNFDIRWEWFMNPGEILSVSGFYKDFTNPIQRVIVNANGNVQMRNVASARLYGLEFEARKSLGFISALENFQLGVNVTIVNSIVDLSESEYLLNKSYDPNASRTRQLQGQSPYVINLDLAYVNYDLGLDAGLHFNVFGERLSDVSLGGTPDIFEQPRNMLNFTFSKRLIDNLNLKFTARNLLDARMEKLYHFKGQEFYNTQYDLGTTLSLGFSYTFE